MTKLKQIQEEIIEVGHRLVQKGLVVGTWGNISCRVEEGVILVTPSGRDYLSLKPKDLVLVNLSGRVLDGALAPSSELPLHLAVYLPRSDVQAVVHTHSVFASVCAVARRSIPPIIEDMLQVIGGSIEVAPYALPGTDELALNAVKMLERKNAVLLANHGVLGCGTSLTEAMLSCELVEKSAQIFLYAQNLGGAVPLSQNDIDAMHQFYQSSYRLRKGGVDHD